MAIEKQTTECIILASYDQGEHDRVYKLFTRDFGTVMVHARSIRKLESKLRLHMHVGRTSLVTLVKGKEVWRLVGASDSGSKRESLEIIRGLLERYSRGEGGNRALYDRLIALSQEETIYDRDRMRILAYYMILVALGYADALVIGARTLPEYVSWSVGDLYTHLLLKEKEVKSHMHMVVREIQL